MTAAGDWRRILALGALLVASHACTREPDPASAAAVPLRALLPGDLSPEMLLPPGPIGRAFQRAHEINVASGAGIHLVVWRDYGSVHAVRVRASDNMILDPVQFPLVRGTHDCARTTPASAPAAAYDGRVFLVAWGALDKLCAVRVGVDGVVLDSTPTQVTAASGSISAAAVSPDGANFLVGWENSLSERSTDLLAARIRSSDGALLDPAGFALTTAPGHQKSPSISFDGTNHLVVWNDYRAAVAALRGTRPCFRRQRAGSRRHATGQPGATIPNGDRLRRDEPPAGVRRRRAGRPRGARAGQ